MATLVLSAVGSAIGGPFGGTVGALIGQQIDGAIFGPKPTEGPRLKELALTTSTYGQPIPRHFGRVRTGGTVIWATDLKEDRETSGGKGRPKTTTFSYSASFAVALGCGPVDGVGRVWADGNLLRGAAGDLKVAGTMRFHSGRGDQAPDPLLLAAEGAKCPAFRGRAYAVFEDLQLADFGNRLPTLSFEVFAGTGAGIVPALLEEIEAVEPGEVRIPQLEGFSHDGGSYRRVLAELASVHPLYPEPAGSRLRFGDENSEAEPALLAEAAAWSDGEFGRQDGQSASRQGSGAERVEGLRYYDVERDYQPGLQRTAGRYQHGSSRLIEFPGSLSAAGARELADAAAQRSHAARETLTWRVAELDPAVVPGSVVRAPGHAGLWRVAAWEWREGGVELELIRHVQAHPARHGGDAGAAWTPADLRPGTTLLRFFELPPASPEDADRPALFAAVRSGGALWKGAALYRDRQGELVPLTQIAGQRAGMGSLRIALPPSPGLRFEPFASCLAMFPDPPPQLAPATMAALAEGANRVLVGGEVLQFADARPVEPGVWRLVGLLRGRGGTEHAALLGHAADTPVILLDGGLTAIDAAEMPDGSQQTLVAIGFGDAEPVAAELQDAGATRRPLPPVHCRMTTLPDGGLELRWTRRARGAWLWRDGVDMPLVEEDERYVAGIGDPDGPQAIWSVTEPRLRIEAETAASLARAYTGSPVWVRQIGSYAQSPPSLVGHLR